MQKIIERPREAALRLTSCAFAFSLVALLVRPAAADPVADFYRGKTVTCYVGYGVGGGYDLIARTISRFLGRHIPGNPTILPVNMPGASSMLLANFLAKKAPADGTAFGAVNSALVYEPMFDGASSKAQFSGPDITMIGNAVSSASILIAWATTGIKSIDDVRQKPFLVGATSKSGDTYLQPLAVKNVLGLDKMRIITGYPGTREAALALEQGEIEGRVWDMEGIIAARPDWLKDHRVNILAQLAPQKMPEVPAGVPLVKDYVTNDDDKKVLDVIFMSTILARPYIAPPGVPAERIAALRDAFMATMRDPEFLAETNRMALTIAPTSGSDMQRIVRDNYELPDTIIQKVRKALSE
jgi:tripartite-type tricarboxylate transporter receptor subunit TctC